MIPCFCSSPIYDYEIFSIIYNHFLQKNENNLKSRALELPQRLNLVNYLLKVQVLGCTKLMSYNFINLLKTTRTSHSSLTL